MNGDHQNCNGRGVWTVSPSAVGHLLSWGARKHGGASRPGPITFHVWLVHQKTSQKCFALPPCSNGAAR